MEVGRFVLNCLKIKKKNKKKKSGGEREVESM